MNKNLTNFASTEQNNNKRDRDGFNNIDDKLDKKINIKLNAGVVANFYMGNTITGQDGNFESLELDPGLSSPYRTVSFSGITGVSVGYNFLNNFDLIVEPNYSQALQPLTRVESDFNASPSGFGMMAGLRYRFRR